jgi:catechol 2,3-dioxygenase-like lactoylglutathione lyase family enzyme
MFTHVMIGSNDLERTIGFYDATFAALEENPVRWMREEG